MSNAEFLGIAIKNLLEKNINVSFVKRKYYSKYSTYSYFTIYPKKELIINYFKEDYSLWFGDFLHEYCHFLQWKENLKKWNSLDKDFAAFDAYISGGKRKPTRQNIINIQKLESNADRRVIHLVQKNKLDLDVKDYIKNSNLYVFCYPLFVKHQIFHYPCQSDMIKYMPETFFTYKQIENRKVIKHVDELDDMFEKSLLLNK